MYVAYDLRAGELLTVAPEHPLQSMSTLWTLLIAPALQQFCRLCIDAELRDVAQTVRMSDLTTIRADTRFAGWTCDRF